MAMGEGDVTRQAELVVMEYLKSSGCAATLDAVMSSSGLATSPVASELYAVDHDMKKKMGAPSVLVCMLASILKANIPSEASALSSSTSRRGSRYGTNLTNSSSAKCEETSILWAKDEVNALKKAIKQTGNIEDKTERWNTIASLVGSGKTKKLCYLKYKELKEEKRKSLSSTSSRSRRSSNEGEPTNKKMLSPNRDSHREDETSTTSTNERARKEQKVRFEVAEEAIATNFSFFEAPTTKPMARGAELADGKSQMELEVEDCDEFDAPPPVAHAGIPISSNKNRGYTSLSSTLSSKEIRQPTGEEINSLRDILFPDGRSNFSSHWDGQGFYFSDVRNLQYGMVQNQGGPCGVLAVLQAYVLRFLLTNAKVKDWKNPASNEQKDALVSAISHVLWQAARVSNRSHCVLAVNDSKSVATSKRKFMSGIRLQTLTSPEQTYSVLADRLPDFTAPKGNGLVLVVISVLLSKGIEFIKPEMDSVGGALGGGGKLIGGHDYCTQEMVNLLLVGVACSNVFNGKQILEGTHEDDSNAVVLKGIPKQSTVGFLSLFEAYEYMNVGSYLKNPQFNIWVVSSESHYSVFMAEPKSLEDRDLDYKQFVEVYYYDGLANQDEEIRLSVATKAREERMQAKSDELVPPLNLVLQTKWPLAEIDWNGVEPLL